MFLAHGRVTKQKCFNLSLCESLFFFFFLKILSVDSKMSVGRFWRTCPSTENFRRQTTAKRPSPKVDLTSMTAVTAMTDTYCYVWITQPFAERQGNNITIRGGKGRSHNYSFAGGGYNFN